MSLNKDLTKEEKKQREKEFRRERQTQNRTGKIAMWIVFGVAAVLAIIAIVIWIRSGVALF
jgi:hypothetical protein